MYLYIWNKTATKYSGIAAETSVKPPSPNSHTHIFSFILPTPVVIHSFIHSFHSVPQQCGSGLLHHGMGILMGGAGGPRQPEIGQRGSA